MNSSQEQFVEALYLLFHSLHYVSLEHWVKKIFIPLIQIGLRGVSCTKRNDLNNKEKYFRKFRIYEEIITIINHEEVHGECCRIFDNFSYK